MIQVIKNRLQCSRKGYLFGNVCCVAMFSTVSLLVTVVISSVLALSVLRHRDGIWADPDALLKLLSMIFRYAFMGSFVAGGLAGLIYVIAMHKRWYIARLSLFRRVVVGMGIGLVVNFQWHFVILVSLGHFSGNTIPSVVLSLMMVSGTVGCALSAVLMGQGFHRRVFVS